tara:strand:- start:28930 stop:29343 length:414 start_codon:yes stop_codon:yes gene_type:complete
MNISSEGKTERPFYGERKIANSQIICFENPNKKRNYEISIELTEFTCKCPFSGYPDFGIINISYQPNKSVIELKSIKLYINRYRDEYISHEEVANRILDDIVSACSPHWMHLNFDFNPRGNVKMNINLFHGKKLTMD